SRGIPQGRATMLPRITAPGSFGGSEEAPDLGASFRVIGNNLASDLELSAGYSNDNQIIGELGSHRDGEVIVKVHHGRFPENRAGVRIKGDKDVIETADEDLAISNRDSTAGPATAYGELLQRNHV